MFAPSPIQIREIADAYVAHMANALVLVRSLTSRDEVRATLRQLNDEVLTRMRVELICAGASVEEAEDTLMDILAEAGRRGGALATMEAAGTA